MLAVAARPAPNPAPTLTPSASMGQRGTRFPGTPRPPFSGGLRERESTAWPIEKEAETMPTQKTFKRRVRARMAKTGESYAAARHQLLRKATSASDPTPAPEAPDLPTSDDAAVRATGRRYDDWFRLLDAWGGTERRHPEIAHWLVSEHGVNGWWSQSITVAYERARGMRALHQMPDGFAVAATRTIAVGPERLLAAFTDDAARAKWLPGVAVRRRRTTAAGTARFDWPDPPSRLIVMVDPRGPGSSRVAIQHEKLADADAAAREKAAWRERLATLKSMLEGGG
jgi:hypothetical protein